MAFQGFMKNVFIYLRALIPSLQMGPNGTPLAGLNIYVTEISKCMNNYDSPRVQTVTRTKLEGVL